jgi:uncharacterized protein (DUF1330 family)
MKTASSVGLAMRAGAAFGALAVSGLHAQGKPGAYAVIDITEINDPDTFETLLRKAAAARAVFGGQFLIRTENFRALDGTPPKRFIVLGFGSVDKAKAWHASAGQQEVDAIRIKSMKSRAFIVEAMRAEICIVWTVGKRQSVPTTNCLEVSSRSHCGWRRAACLSMRRKVDRRDVQHSEIVGLSRIL